MRSPVRCAAGAEPPGVGLLEPPSVGPRRPRARKGFGGSRPPRAPGDDGDGGWNDDGWEGEGGGSKGRARPPGTSELGFWFLLTSVGTLFLVFLGAYVVLRKHQAPWPAVGSPAPPGGLWWSTLVLLSSSASLACAQRAQSAGRVRALRRGLTATLALGVAFLCAQALLWQSALRAGLSASLDGYGAVFYALTGLHALHVVGGLAFLGVLVFESWRRRPLAEWATSMHLGSIYWHYMGAIWLVLFAVLYLVE